MSMHGHAKVPNSPQRHPFGYPGPIHVIVEPQLTTNRAVKQPIRMNFAGQPMTRRRMLAGALAISTLSLIACDDGSPFASLASSGVEAHPGGQGVAIPVRVAFRLRRPASIEVILRNEVGKEWMLRPTTPRIADEDYEIVFDGSVPDGTQGDRTVVANGPYDVRIAATENNGTRIERTIPVRVVGGDDTPLNLEGPRLSLNAISPDGDGVDDEVKISMRLSKAAMIDIAADDGKGTRSPIVAQSRRDPGEIDVLWDGSSGGRVFGGKRLADGQYTITVQARDAAGNVRIRQAPLRITNGGMERLEIADASISPTRVRVGQPITVRVTVINTGETTIRTMGPPPGSGYSTQDSFSTLIDPTSANKSPYEMVSGAWRVGLGWQTASQELPIRWGLLPDLGSTIPPGGSAIVEATVVVREPPNPGLRFWVGAIREGVAFATGRVGDRVVVIDP